VTSDNGLAATKSCVFLRLRVFSGYPGRYARRFTQPQSPADQSSAVNNQWGGPHPWTTESGI